MDTEFEYFKWLVESIDPNHTVGEDYQPVLEKLYFTDFTWMKKYYDDENRARDGVYLRTTFMESNRLYRDRLREEFDEIERAGGIAEEDHWFYKKPCSCLEMMVSVARRIEYEIVALPGEENVPKWFWSFVENMGIAPYMDGIKNPEYVEEKIHKWLSRRYQRNGYGGIFVVRSDYFDMPKMPIRKQMYAVLNENMDF